MKKGLIITIVIVAVLLLLGIFFVSAYNGFVRMDQDVNGKWSEVENQYQRQADLIPNIVSAVSSAVSVETKFVKDVIQARTTYAAAKNTLDKDKAGIEMASSMATFVNAVAENYPTLQANKQYTTLTDELSGTQNRITTARGRYIESIQTYNTATKRFPSTIIAGMFGFTAKEYYKASEGSMKTPQLGSGQLPQ